MKIKTSELTGAALDWAVAKCLGQDEEYVLYPEQFKLLRETSADSPFFYSTDWAQGGPIIERECIGVLPPVTRRIGAERYAFPVDYWRALLQRDENESVTHGRGPTPLVAAMRCYVASKLGDEVDVPEELM